MSKNLIRNCLFSRNLKHFFGQIFFRAIQTTTGEMSVLGVCQNNSQKRRYNANNGIYKGWLSFHISLDLIQLTELLLNIYNLYYKLRRKSRPHYTPLTLDVGLAIMPIRNFIEINAVTTALIRQLLTFRSMIIHACEFM